MAIAVVMNAQLQCTCGSAPSQLIVTSQMQIKIDNQLAATVMDSLPIANITPFGTCTVLTAAALGVPTPCVPAAVGPWTPGSLTVKVGNLSALLSTDMVTCAIGGMITITNPGQQQTEES
jgi:Domain of unknown function (DUF4280)